MRPDSLIALILRVVFCSCSALAGIALADDLAVTHYTEVSTERISRFEYDYTLRADLTNSGPALTRVGAVLAALPNNVTVVEGALSFGDVPAGATVTSQDSFVVRVDRRYDFDPASFRWSFSFDSAQKLTSNFRAVPAEGNAPLRVTFYPEPVSDSAVRLYAWDRDGDGTFETETVKPVSVTYTYTQPGVYRPGLRVVDARNAEDTKTLTLEVGNGPPTVQARAAPTNGRAPLNVTFYFSATDSEQVALYEWDFEGDGVFDFTATAADPVPHTYPSAGDFAPVLRVTDRLGAAAIHRTPATEVRVEPQGSPTARATVTPGNGNAPLEVTFSGTASHPGGQAIVLWEWDFEGDGTYDYSSPASAAATHMYSAAGMFYPRLRIKAADNSTAEDVKPVTVRAQHALSLSADTLDPNTEGAVTVDLVLGGDTRSSVVIENRSGQVVKTLAPWAERPIGTHSFSWRGDGDNGQIVAEGPYYAILLYQTNGEEKRLDLALTTGGAEYQPATSPIPPSFAPFAGQPLTIDFELSDAAEVSAYMGRLSNNLRLVTFMERLPLGRGAHRLVWNGESDAGQSVPLPPDDSFVFGILAYRLPDNAVYVRSGAHVGSLAVTPSILDPSVKRSKLALALDRPAAVELVVNDYDTGAIVARRVYNGLAAGTAAVYWDGRNDTGVYVAPGNYRLGITAIDGNGYRSLPFYALQRVYY